MYGTNNDLTREVRLHIEQLHQLDDLLRREIRRRTKSIETAQANAAAGAKIQHGTLGAHITARKRAQATREAVQVAIKQIQWQLVQAVERTAGQLEEAPLD